MPGSPGARPRRRRRGSDLRERVVDRWHIDRDDRCRQTTLTLEHPPLIAPGSVGAYVSGSTAVVTSQCTRHREWARSKCPIRTPAVQLLGLVDVVVGISKCVTLAMVSPSSGSPLTFTRPVSPSRPPPLDRIGHAGVALVHEPTAPASTNGSVDADSRRRRSLTDRPTRAACAKARKSACGILITRCLRHAGGVFEGFVIDDVDVGFSRDLHVRYRGDGPALLLLHGHPRTGAT